MPDAFTVSPFDFFVLPTRTRFPFKYGIASMTDVPHLFVRTRVHAGRDMSDGLSAEGLPPKWFTKDPSTTFEQDLPAMYDAIRHAAHIAAAVASQPLGFFDFSRELDRQQGAWARNRKMPPLLAHLGVSLVERAVLDGLCRIAGQPIHRLIAVNRLGVRLGEVYDALGAAEPGDLLPSGPVERCLVRHTIGLGDALSAADVPGSERVDDGLPQDLESSIREYGLRYFKVKLSGVDDRDRARLRDLQRLLEHTTAGDYHLTLDGNENFADVAAFKEFWASAGSEPAIAALWRRILVVEQPVHRSRALNDEVGVALRNWTDRPPLIIDESDGAVGDVPRALDLGYAGASYKSCKGIVKGLANACLLSHRRRDGQPGILTGEDLCTLGPVALLQDLAMMALLGIGHVERNGHHYYRGLSVFPREWQERTSAAHDDLYEWHPDGFARLRIREGRLELGSINASALGVGPRFDPSIFERQVLTAEESGAR